MVKITPTSGPRPVDIESVYAAGERRGFSRSETAELIQREMGMEMKDLLPADVSSAIDTIEGSGIESRSEKRSREVVPLADEPQPKSTAIPQGRTSERRKKKPFTMDLIQMRTITRPWTQAEADEMTGDLLDALNARQAKKDEKAAADARLNEAIKEHEATIDDLRRKLTRGTKDDLMEVKIVRDFDLGVRRLVHPETGNTLGSEALTRSDLDLDLFTMLDENRRRELEAEVAEAEREAREAADVVVDAQVDGEGEDES